MSDKCIHCTNKGTCDQTNCKKGYRKWDGECVCHGEFKNPDAVAKEYNYLCSMERYGV